MTGSILLSLTRQAALGWRHAATVLVFAMAIVGCQAPADPAAEEVDTAPASRPASGIAAVELFLETWNSRDVELWASSLRFPHVRPTPGAHRVFENALEYQASFDYEPVIATGWERTVFESLEVIHDGNQKSHVAGRWARLDASDQVIRTNQVSYVVTGDETTSLGVQARFSAGPPIEGDLASTNEAAALAVVDEYMSSFNARDPEAWAATLHYPHIRLAGDDLVVTETAEDMALQMDFAAFAERFSWHRSAWDDVRAIQVGAQAVNVALTFSRFDDQDQVLSTFDTLYLVTLEEGRWGIRARSSFAP